MTCNAGIVKRIAALTLSLKGLSVSFPCLPARSTTTLQEGAGMTGREIALTFNDYSNALELCYNTVI